MIETTRYVRKPFEVDAVQVTVNNIHEVAKWVKGEVKSDKDGKQYVKVNVTRAMNDRQKQAYVNDWVLLANNGFKVYTPKAFNGSFEQVSVESTLHETSTAPASVVTPLEDGIVVTTEQVPETVVAAAKKARPKPGPRREAAVSAEAV